MHPLIHERVEAVPSRASPQDRGDRDAVKPLHDPPEDRGDLVRVRPVPDLVLLEPPAGDEAGHDVWPTPALRVLEQLAGREEPRRRESAHSREDAVEVALRGEAGERRYLIGVKLDDQSGGQDEHWIRTVGAGADGPRS